MTSTWLAAIPILAVVVMLVTLVWYQISRKKRRVQLRLLSGQRRLLGDQISARSKNLLQFDDDTVSTLKASAVTAIDLLQAEIVARQTHLSNYEDLTFLQKQRISTLRGKADYLESEDGQQIGPTDTTPSPGLQPRHQVEGALLDQIKKSQQPKSSRQNE